MTFFAFIPFSCIHAIFCIFVFFAQIFRLNIQKRQVWKYKNNPTKCALFLHFCLFLYNFWNWTCKKAGGVTTLPKVTGKTPNQSGLQVLYYNSTNILCFSLKVFQTFSYFFGFIFSLCIDFSFLQKLKMPKISFKWDFGKKCSNSRQNHFEKY